jgi:hypothetical protein
MATLNAGIEETTFQDQDSVPAEETDSQVGAVATAQFLEEIAESIVPAPPSPLSLSTLSVEPSKPAGTGGMCLAHYAPETGPTIPQPLASNTTNMVTTDWLGIPAETFSEPGKTSPIAVQNNREGGRQLAELIYQKQASRTDVPAEFNSNQALASLQKYYENTAKASPDFRQGFNAVANQTALGVTQNTLQSIADVYGARAQGRGIRIRASAAENRIDPARSKAIPHTGPDSLAGTQGIAQTGRQGPVIETIAVPVTNGQQVLARAQQNAATKTAGNGILPTFRPLPERGARADASSSVPHHLLPNAPDGYHSTGRGMNLSGASGANGGPFGRNSNPQDPFGAFGNQNSYLRPQASSFMPQEPHEGAQGGNAGAGQPHKIADTIIKLRKTLQPAGDGLTRSYRFLTDADLQTPSSALRKVVDLSVDPKDAELRYNAIKDQVLNAIDQTTFSQSSRDEKIKMLDQALAKLQSQNFLAWNHKNNIPVDLSHLSGTPPYIAKPFDNVFTPLTGSIKTAAVKNVRDTPTFFDGLFANLFRRILTGNSNDKNIQQSTFAPEAKPLNPAPADKAQALENRNQITGGNPITAPEKPAPLLSPELTEFLTRSANNILKGATRKTDIAAHRDQAIANMTRQHPSMPLKLAIHTFDAKLVNIAGGLPDGSFLLRKLANARNADPLYGAGSQNRPFIEIPPATIGGAPVQTIGRFTFPTTEQINRWLPEDKRVDPLKDPTFIEGSAAEQILKTWLERDSPTNEG